MKKLIILFIIIAFLSSCIGIKNEVKLNKDLSGTIQWQYRIDNSMYQLGRLGEQSKDIPLPVLKEDFQRVCDQTEGLSLESYELKESEDQIVITGLIGFSHVSLLNRISSLSDAGGQWEVSEKSLGLHLNFNSSLELSEDDKAMMKEVFEGYSLEFVIKPPGLISSSTHGNISTDKKQVSIIFSYLEALELKDDYIQINWQ